MSLIDLKNKLHAIFESCEQESVVEDAVPPTPVVTPPVVEPQTITTQPVEKDYTAPTGIVYKISYDDASKKYNVNNQDGSYKDTFTIDLKDQDGDMTKEDRQAIINILTPESQTVQITNPEQPSDIKEPEVVVAEDKKIISKFKQQYGKDGEGIYYATATAQKRDPETFEKN